MCVYILQGLALFIDTNSEINFTFRYLTFMVTCPIKTISPTGHIWKHWIFFGIHYNNSLNKFYCKIDNQHQEMTSTSFSPSASNDLQFGSANTTFQLDDVLYTSYPQADVLDVHYEMSKSAFYL